MESPCRDNLDRRETPRELEAEIARFVAWHNTELYHEALYHEALGNVTLDEVHYGRRGRILGRRRGLKEKMLAHRRRQNQGKPGLKEADRTEKPSLAPTA